MNDFYFELTNNEFENLRSKFSTANFSKTRRNPKIFTEQGIPMFERFEINNLKILDYLKK